MTLPYDFHQRVIVRTPMLPLPAQSGEIDLPSLVSDARFMEAIYLASPVVHEECQKWRNGLITGKKDIDKLKRAISKYFLRMSTRCTPFGLFSGCAVTEWIGEDAGVTLETGGFRRHTRLDMLYLCALAKSLDACPGIRTRLLFYPNSSIYTFGTEIRYVEYLYIDGTRSYRISSVTAFEHLTRVVEFAARGVTLAQLVEFLAVDDVSAEDASAFADELIASQILVSELEPSITGQEFMDQMTGVLERIDTGECETVRSVIRSLKEVKALLASLDEEGGDGIGRYQEIMTLLSGLGIEYQEGKLFQTDTVKKIRKGGIDVCFQNQIREALGVLNRLTLAKGDDVLQSFGRRFYQRYEDKEMPLMEVLDSEIGIGYQEEANGCISPLVEGLPIHSGTRSEPKLAWSKLEVFLNEKLKNTLENNLSCIELLDEEVGRFRPDTTDLPPSLSVLFRVVNKDAIYLESAGGSSAINLLGRFAHSDEKIRDIARDVARHEQEQDPGVVYAEIVHLPESRTGNILLHPAFRNYEIPYLAKSSVPGEFRIDVRDLYVSVRNGKVTLRSKRLKKEVVPRLSTAHNYAYNSLPVYRFLCDLQLQHKKSALVFNWGSLQYQHKFLPRVVYKNTILHLARWNFLQADVESLRNGPTEGLMTRSSGFRAKWKMPRHVLLCEGDNELPIDLENQVSLQLLLDSVKNKEDFLLKEFLRPEDAVSDDTGAVYANQFLAILTRIDSSCPETKADCEFEQPEGPERREFHLGTEWVYFKVYCGIRSADRILLEAMGPMAEELTEKRLIDKWFFVRYNDPDFHLRMRFHLTDTANIGTLIRIAYSHLEAFQSKGYIWKLQTDTYKREIERYGNGATGLAETIFHHDSIACVRMLANTVGDERENIRWMWGLKAVDELLNCFCLSTEDKLSLLQNLRTAFGNEFNVDKSCRAQLNNKYRSNSAMITQVMASDTGLPAHWQPLIKILDERSENIRPMAARIGSWFNKGSDTGFFFSLLGSYIHMMLNRIIAAEQRVHELVIYDFLVRCYKTQMARAEEMAVTG